MAPKPSAGLLLYRTRAGVLEVLLGHMGGPFWSRKDAGAWSIPKGEYEPGEDPFEAATREFEEELGTPAPATVYRDLGSSTLGSGKVVTIWATEAEFDESTAVSNTFELEWPRGSGQLQTFPELDRVAWCAIEVARTRLTKGQVSFLDRLTAILS